MIPPAGDHAVVLGASIAGLLTARVLADSFARVTLVERDPLPDGPLARRGVPQAHQVHTLLARGAQLLGGWFPGVAADLVADGAVVADAGARIRFLLGGHRLHPVTTGRDGVFCSRLLLEHHVRRAVRALPNVEVRDGCDVLHPLDDGRRVTGVALRTRAGAEEHLPADLVVDATGRGSRTPRWLTDTGRTPPPEDRVVVDTTYLTAAVRLRPGALGDDVAVLTSAAPGHPRAGALFTVEGGICTAGVAGSHGDVPHPDLDGLRTFAASLAFPDMADALEGAELVAPPRAARFPANVRRRYERLRDLPDGLLVVGDALCAFNPVYGQGMTVAAIEADALARLLARGGVPSPAGYARAAFRASAPAWDLATGSDLRDPRTAGPRPRSARLVGAYVDRLQAAAEHDAVLSGRFLSVSSLVAPPSALFRPDVLGRVAWAGLRGAPAPVRVPARA